jgi:hypothetical protein
MKGSDCDLVDCSPTSAVQGAAQQLSHLCQGRGLHHQALGMGEGRQFERCAAAFRRQRQETVEDRFVVLAGQQLVIIGADAEIERGADSCYMPESLRQWSGMTDFRTLWVEGWPREQIPPGGNSATLTALIVALAWPVTVSPMALRK